jgi:hypothetical protein
VFISIFNFFNRKCYFDSFYNAYIVYPCLHLSYVYNHVFEHLFNHLSMAFIRSLERLWTAGLNTYR